MSSRKEVARLAGVSETTVTNVLNNLKPASKEVEERVYAAARALNYQPNVIAQSLRTKNSRQIGVILSDISNPYVGEILRGIEEQSAALGYNTILIMISDDIRKKYKDIVGRRFTGLINISNVPYTYELMKELYDNGVSLINFKPGYASIVQPQSRFYELMDRAAKLGHKKPMYIVGYPQDTAPLDDRYVTYFENYSKLGFTDHDKKVIYGDFPKTSLLNIGYEAVKANFDPADGVTVLFCLNDICALGAMSALREMGVKVPQDVSVTGYDNIPMSRYFTPPLTTVDAFAFEQGKEMVLAITRKIEGGECETIAFKTEPIFRESLAPAPKNR